MQPQGLEELSFGTVSALDVLGTELEIFQAGGGPPLLFLHGLDRIEGYITPAELEAGFRGGEERERADEVEAEVLREIAGSGDVRVIDVRSATEFAAGHLPGALNFPHTRLSARLEEIPATEPLYVHCQAGSRSAAAVAYLRRKGRPAINVRGGFARLSELGVPTVTGAGHPTVAAEG